MILGVAAIQGLVLALVVLLNKRGNRLGNRVLSALLIIFSFILIEESLESFQLHHEYHRITGFGFFMDILLGPITFVYALILINNNFKWSKSLRTQLMIPILLNLIYLPYHFLINWDAHLINHPNLSALFTSIIVVKIIYQLVYQVISIRSLTLYIRKANSDNAQFKVALWLRNVLSLTVILIPLVLLVEGMQDRLIFDSDFVTSIILIFAIYSVGYAALRNPMVYARPTDAMKFSGSSFSGDAGSKYTTSSLSAEQKETYKRLIQDHMVLARPYLNSDLTANDLAHQLNLTRHHLSQVLNEGFDQNFYDFINAYRVKEVIRRIESEEHLKVNILALGLESGFNSKATFNRAFKKSTGDTPLDYIKSLETA